MYATLFSWTNVIKTLERIRFFSNQNIGEGESNFDEKNVEEVLNLCSTE